MVFQSSILDFYFSFDPDVLFITKCIHFALQNHLAAFAEEKKANELQPKDLTDQHSP